MPSGTGIQSVHRHSQRASKQSPQPKCWCTKIQLSQSLLHLHMALVPSSHILLPDGSERPIAFASRTLTASQQNYAQLEKEELSGLRNFSTTMRGGFTLVTDHKPLTAILGPKKDVPSIAAARLQCWAVLFSAYKYNIKFKSTQAHANADGLSRLPLTTLRGVLLYLSWVSFVTRWQDRVPSNLQ